MKPAVAIACLFGLAACSPQLQPEARKDEPAPPPAITQFYASPATVAKGGRSLLCYGVQGAASVRLEPPVDEIAPALARCLEVKAESTTRYTLFAKNKAGVEVSQQVELVVDPKLQGPTPPVGLIQFFTAVSPKVPKGLPTTLCYGVKGAASVNLTPPVQTLVPSEKICFQVRPDQTTTYTLTANSASGVKDTESIRIVVE